MTPRERANEAFKAVYGYDAIEIFKGDTEGCFIQQMEQAITADRAQLQAEIERLLNEQKRLSLMEGIATHNTHYFQTGITRALNIVQSVFSQSSSAEEKPVKVWHGRARERIEHLMGLLTINIDADFWSGVERQMIEYAEAESDRRVLAEREACAEIAKAHRTPMLLNGCKNPHPYYDSNRGFKLACEMIEEDIRARSNPQPAPTVDGIARKLGEQAEEIRTLKKERDEITQHLFTIGERLEKLEKIFDPDGHTCRNCPACEGSD